MGRSWGHQELNTTERLSYDSKVRTREKLSVRVFLLLCVQVPFFPHNDVNVYFLSFSLYTKVATLPYIYFFFPVFFYLYLACSSMAWVYLHVSDPSSVDRNCF